MKKFSSPVVLAIVQGLNNSIWLEVTLMESTDIKISIIAESLLDGAELEGISCNYVELTSFKIIP